MVLSHFLDGMKKDHSMLKEANSEEQFDEDEELDREEYSYEADEKDSDNGVYQGNFIL